MTAERLTLVNAVVTHLAGITVANGYSVNTSNVLHGRRILHQELQHLPCLDVYVSKELATHRPLGQIDSMIPLTVVGAVANVDIDGAIQYMTDVENRMSSWRDESGFSTLDMRDILLRGSDVDQGNDSLGLPFTSFQCDFEVHYGYAIGSA